MTSIETIEQSLNFDCLYLATSRGNQRSFLNFLSIISFLKVAIKKENTSEHTREHHKLFSTEVAYRLFA